VADGVPAPTASRRTTRVLVIAAVALTGAIGVLVTLPGRGTPTVVAKATPSGASPAAVASATPSQGQAGPTGSPTSSPAWSPSGSDPPTTAATTSTATSTSTSEPIGTSTSRTSTRRPTTAPATRRPTVGPPTGAPTTRRPPPRTGSAVAVSPLPGFGYGEHVTLLDPAVLDRRVVDVGGAAVMQVISASSSASVLKSASWVVRRGLADRGCVSPESVSAHGRYLVSSAGRLAVAARSGSGFDGAATFCVRSPALDGTWGVSLNPWNQATMTVTRRPDGLLGVRPSGASPRSQTFKLWAAPA
jgi:Alpha-L-arabinofuranosidase B (ABFB) domain